MTGLANIHEVRSSYRACGMDSFSHVPMLVGKVWSWGCLVVSESHGVPLAVGVSKWQ